MIAARYAMRLIRAPPADAHSHEVQSLQPGNKRRRVESLAEETSNIQPGFKPVDLTSTPPPRSMAIETPTERRSNRKVERQAANVQASAPAVDRDERDNRIARLVSRLQSRGMEVSRLKSDLWERDFDLQQASQSVRSRHNQNGEISRLKSNLEAQEHELQEALLHIRDLKSQNKDLFGELKKRNQDADDLNPDQDHNFQRMSQQVHNTRAENSFLLTELKKRDREIVSLKSEQASILGQNEKLNKDVRGLQEASFSTLEDPHWMPMDSSKLLDSFSKLRKTVNNIAKSSATEDFSNLNHMQNDQRIKLRDLLSPTVSFQSEGLEGLKELVGIKHAPRLCLASVISDTVHDLILSRPFFSLGMGDDNGVLVAAGELKGLPTLHAIFSAYDQNKAQRWRSDTLRLLNPTHLGNTQTSQEQLIGLQATIAKIGKGLAKKFNDQKLPGLLREMGDIEREKFVSELTQLFVLAGQTSLRLWCQRPEYRLKDLSKLAQEPFSTSSELLQPHPLHKHSDPFDTSLDGKLPKIVVHPAISSFGTHKGEHYDQSRLLEKAVVWLEV